MKHYSTKPSRLSVRNLMASVLVLILALTGATSDAAAGPSTAANSVHPAYEVQDLGPAIESTNIRTAGFGVDTDGREVIFAVSNGDPATFSVLDAATGERRFAHVLEGFEFGGWTLQTDDGRVFFTARTGSRAGLLEFDPQTRVVTELDVDLRNQKVLYKGSLDDSGVIFFGTYPNAKLMSYDTDTGAIRDYGTLTNDAAYAFSAGIVDGEVWVGTGPVPHLFRVDPDSGTAEEILVPERFMDNVGWFIGIEERDGHVFVRLSPRGGFDMAVYDLVEDRWHDEIIGGSFGVEVSEAIDGKVYYLEGDILRGYDLEKEKTFSTGFENSEIHEDLATSVGTYAFRVAASDSEHGGGHVATGINTDGIIWSYDLRSGEGSTVVGDALGSPSGAHSIGVGPDGAMYLGAYLSSGVMGRIDPETLKVDHIRGPKQSDAIMSHNDRLVVSSYPGALVHDGEVSGGFEWDEAREVLYLGRGEPYFQDRIFALASAGDRIAVGTVPDYGQLGGALTLVDPESGEFDFHRNIVQDQSVVALDHKDGILFGGTSVHGGMSSTPTASSAEFFIWDIEAQELLASETLDSEVRVIHEVTVGPDGRVWILTDTSQVFIADAETGAIVHRIDTGLPRNSNNWGRTTSLFHHDGWVFINSGRTLARMHPTTHEVQVIVSGGVHEAGVDGLGQIFFADDRRVYSLTPVEPECTEQIRGVVDGPLRVNSGTVCVLDATVDGPLTVSYGASLVLSRSTIEGPIRADGAGTVSLVENAVTGPVQIVGSAGEVELLRNEVAGPLACSGNEHAPVGAGNSVSGPSSGQCRGF